MKRAAPYGTWASPISAEIVAGGTGGVRLMDVALDGDTLFWIEVRPTEAARAVVMARGADGVSREVTPADFSARSRVHEYGGGAFAVHDGAVYFTNFSDQQIWRVDARGGTPTRITTRDAQRYADMLVDPHANRLLAVTEDHAGEGEPANRLVAVALGGGGAEAVIAEGDDFYASPCLSPDGGRLAWLSWSHPNMPWDGTRLWSCEGAGPARIVAGGDAESIFQPAFAPDGTLHYVSDRSGWWNLYSETAGVLQPMAAEFGRPQWVFGMSTYGFLEDGSVLCTWQAEGRWRLGRLADGELTPLGAAYSDVSALRVRGGRAAALLSRDDRPGEVAEVNVRNGETESVRAASDDALDPAGLSRARAISFDAEDGSRAHAFFYPPTSAAFEGLAGEAPPLVVKSHGGPTAATSDGFSLAIQFWTSRGFAVLDVNYGGSSGYGRAYRERLEGQWGVVDVADCTAGALYCAAEGLVDGERLAISGGSAGGYTTLSALTFRDVFKAGASHYGIGDLDALAKHTHKFEARYLDSLIGPWPARADLYRARTPIHHTDRLSCPAIFLQGLEDKVVPPEQSEAMVAALAAAGIPVAYVPFEGEQHGFRKSENIRRALEAELWFYGRVFAFTPADAIAPVDMR